MPDVSPAEVSSLHTIDGEQQVTTPAARPATWRVIAAPVLRPLERIPASARRRLGALVLLAAALVFPVIHSNGGDVDAVIE